METDTFVRSTIINAPADSLGGWHHRQGALRRLIPPWIRYKFIDEPGELKDGARPVIKTRLAPLIWSKWISELQNVKPGGNFTDLQIKGPFAHWLHQHRFIEKGAEKSQLNDAIEYRVPLGPVGKFLGGWFVRHQLEQMFRYRHTTTRMDLERLEKRPVEPLRILISGATGLVGTALTSFLQTCGHTTLALTRTPRPGSSDIAWNPAEGELNLTDAGAIDAVVHLAGENVAGRWSKKKKARILSSRRDGTRLLCEALARLPVRPSVIVGASGVNYYETDALNTHNEDSPIGTSFLSEVCRVWEDGTRAAKEADIRVVNLRIGFVLSPGGGGLKLMLPAFRAGLGGRIGNGRQRLSWIAIDDLIDIIHHCLTDKFYAGAVNAVSPEPATNREFTKALGSTLHRPTILPVPATPLKALLGEFAQETLLADLPVYPTRLLDHGYEFRFPKLEPALAHLLGKHHDENGPSLSLA